MGELAKATGLGIIFTALIMVFTLVLFILCDALHKEGLGPLIIILFSLFPIFISILIEDLWQWMYKDDSAKEIQEELF